MPRASEIFAPVAGARHRSPRERIPAADGPRNRAGIPLTALGGTTAKDCRSAVEKTVRLTVYRHSVGWGVMCRLIAPNARSEGLVARSGQRILDGPDPDCGRSAGARVSRVANRATGSAMNFRGPERNAQKWKPAPSVRRAARNSARRQVPTRPGNPSREEWYRLRERAWRTRLRPKGHNSVVHLQRRTSATPGQWTPHPGAFPVCDQAAHG